MKVISHSGGGTGNLTRHMKKLHGNVSIEQPICEQLQAQVGLPRCTESNDIGTDSVPSTSTLSELVVVVPSLCEKTAPAPFARQTTQLQVQSKISNFACLRDHYQLANLRSLMNKL